MDSKILLLLVSLVLSGCGDGKKKSSDPSVSPQSEETQPKISGNENQPDTAPASKPTPAGTNQNSSPSPSTETPKVSAPTEDTNIPPAKERTLLSQAVWSKSEFFQLKASWPAGVPKSRTPSPVRLEFFDEFGQTLSNVQLKAFHPRMPSMGNHGTSENRQSFAAIPEQRGVIEGQGVWLSMGGPWLIEVVFTSEHAGSEIVDSVFFEVVVK